MPTLHIYPKTPEVDKEYHEPAIFAPTGEIEFFAGHNKTILPYDAVTNPDYHRVAIHAHMRTDRGYVAFLKNEGLDFDMRLKMIGSHMSHSVEVHIRNMKSTDLVITKNSNFLIGRMSIVKSEYLPIEYHSLDEYEVDQLIY